MTKVSALASDLRREEIIATNEFPYGVMWISEGGQILHINARLLWDLGYTEEDFIAQTIFQVSPSTNFIQWREYWKKLLADGMQLFDAAYLAADETLRPMKMRGFLVELNGQKICLGIVESELLIKPYLDLLQMLSEMLNAGGWQWTLVDNTYFFTREMYRLLELPENTEINAANIKDLLREWLPERDYAILQDKLRRALQEGKVFEQELSINLPNSQTTHQFWLKGIPYFREGKTVKIYGILQDISNFARRTEDMYLMQYATDNAHELIYWIAPDGSFRYVNDAMCQLLGYTREELLQLKFQDLRTDITAELWQELWNDLRKNGTIQLEVLLKSKNGSEIPVSINAQYQHYLGIELGCVFTRDLRGKKRRDQLIAMASHTVSQARELIYWLDGAGNFVMVNEAFCKRLGYGEEELIDNNIAMVYPDYSLEKGWTKLRTQKFIEGEYFITAKNKERIPVEVFETLVLQEGREYCCGVLRDITERKKRESDLQEAFQEIRKLKEQLESDNKVLKDEIASGADFNGIISISPAYKPVLKQVDQVAETDATVLILGETGTGKELLARALHQLSKRADRPLVKVNCGALPENLIESELFGHEKGAFTGAYQQKKGRFEVADKGTLFLDEIGELPLELQPKLLRVLQEGEFERVGGTQTVKVNVRVIAATNRDLEQQVADGKFRQDLYYRLNVFPIYNIPLRERREDIQLLVRYFVEKFAPKMGKDITHIPQAMLDKLMRYNFPGNVRELENIIERAVILSTGETLEMDLSFLQSQHHKNGDAEVFKTLEEMQRQHILEALRFTNGQVSGEQGAAKILGLNDKTLHSKMKKLKIERLDYLS